MTGCAGCGVPLAPTKGRGRARKWCSERCRKASGGNPQAPLKTTPEKFWGRVDSSGGEHACWPWLGYITQDGYGLVGFERRQRGTHRVAWQLANGPIPDGLWVLHRCDNPPCCNPAHLFLGSVADNNRDRHAKGRTRGWAGRNGPAHHFYRVTPAMLAVAREMRARGWTQQRIADHLNISRGRVAHIVSGVLPVNARGTVLPEHPRNTQKWS